MKKLLLFNIFVLFTTLSSYGQNSLQSADNANLTLACDLNLPGIVPSVNAQCTVEFSDLVIPEITDSCGNIVVPTTDISIFPITATGTTTIFWEYLNELGNIETQFQNINILDFTEPIPDVAILPNFYSQCAVLQTDLPVPTANDNCSPIVTVTNDAVFPITVSTLITWFYTDATGNTSFQPQDIYINDFTEPVADVAILPNIHGLCSVQQTDVPVPTATDNCLGVVTVTSDAIFPITRSTLITWTYTDTNGNSSYQVQDIYIDDITTPIPNNATLADVSALCEILEADVLVPTATDNCTGVIAATSNVVFPITTSTVITWTYTDANGNTETQTQNAFITDATKPVPDVAVLPDFTSQCALLEIDVPVPTATDNCSGVIAATSNAVFPITASTTIIWTYADANGNSETQTQNIVINDTTAPTPDAIVLADITAQCEVLEIDVIAPTATDNCSGIVTVTNDGVFPITTQGATTITWTYTDANGNTSTQTQDILIGDNTSPTVTLTDITVSVNVTGIVTINAAQLENGSANDNCGIASITVTPNTFTCAALGDHVVTVTVIDIHGNSISDTATVTVTDPTDFCGALGVVKNEKATFALYPNPTSDTIYMESGNQTIIHSVSLYSLSGQLISKESNKQKLEKFSLSLSSLPQGMYILKLETNDGTFTERVMKK